MTQVNILTCCVEVAAINKSAFETPAFSNTLIDVASNGTATSGPNISLIASATFVAVLKSP